MRGAAGAGGGVTTVLLELSILLELLPFCEFPEGCKLLLVPLLVEDVDVLFPPTFEGSPEQPVQLFRRTFSSTINRTIATTAPPISIFTQPLFLP